MNDQEDDKKNLTEDIPQPENDNQPSVDDNNQSESEESQNNDSTLEGTESNDQNNNQNPVSEVSVQTKVENDTNDHQVIHKKDGRLHIYIRQDKYKGELKSKNWVGRLYIDGKQKISSSGTPNLEEAIPILEKWFDDLHAESEKLKKIAEEQTDKEKQSDTTTVT